MPRDSLPRSGDVIHPLLWRGSGYETRAKTVSSELGLGKWWSQKMAKMLKGVSTEM